MIINCSDIIRYNIIFGIYFILFFIFLLLFLKMKLHLIIIKGLLFILILMNKCSIILILYF